MNDKGPCKLRAGSSHLRFAANLRLGLAVGERTAQALFEQNGPQTQTAWTAPVQSRQAVSIKHAQIAGAQEKVDEGCLHAAKHLYS
eukprot:scaffold20689_cov16-Tisochrysis_lutea.AAC.1